MAELPSGDRVHDLLLVRLRRLELRDALAEAQDRDPIGALEDVVEVVRDDDDAQVALREAAHQVEHLARLGDPEGRGRLVEDDALPVYPFTRHR